MLNHMRRGLKQNYRIVNILPNTAQKMNFFIKN